MPRRVVIEYRGAAIVVEYRPELVEDAGFLSLVEQVRIRNDVRLHARALSLVLVSWTVERDGRPVPITEASIEPLPLPLTAAIVRGIGDDCARMRRAAALGALGVRSSALGVRSSRKENRRP